MRILSLEYFLRTFETITTYCFLLTSDYSMLYYTFSIFLYLRSIRVLVVYCHCTKLCQNVWFGEEVPHSISKLQGLNSFFLLVYVADKAYHVKSYLSMYIVLFLIRMFFISGEFSEYIWIQNFHFLIIIFAIFGELL